MSAYPIKWFWAKR
jgi:hypothetical protein